MSQLSALADALHLLGKAIDPQSVTKVDLAFSHSPADIPDVATWTFMAALKGTKGLAENGEQVLSFEQTWRGEGGSDAEAFQQVNEQVIQHLRGFHHLRQDEARFAEQAIMTAMAAPTNLAELWRTEDAPSPVATEATAPNETAPSA